MLKIIFLKLFVKIIWGPGNIPFLHKTIIYPQTWINKDHFNPTTEPRVVWNWSTIPVILIHYLVEWSFLQSQVRVCMWVCVHLCVKGVCWRVMSLTLQLLSHWLHTTQPLLSCLFLASYLLLSCLFWNWQISPRRKIAPNAELSSQNFCLLLDLGSVLLHSLAIFPKPSIKCILNFVLIYYLT